MRALAKLVSVNHPDRVFFVGEALVGNEAVDQLSKFDRALRDFSGIGGVSKGRGIDGMIVTKWDTVDDKVSSSFFIRHTGTDESYQRSQVGAALSMTFVTGQPIVFVGTGQVGHPSFLSQDDSSSTEQLQTYTDLRQLRVANVVQAILSE